MREIKLEVTVEEANLMLEGLGALPFARVYALVTKLQQQASRQLGDPAEVVTAGGQELQRSEAGLAGAALPTPDESAPEPEAAHAS